MLLERQTCGEACVRTIGHGWACLVRSGTWARVEEEIEMEVGKGEGGFVAVSYSRQECRNSILIYWQGLFNCRMIRQERQISSSSG